MIVSKPRRHQLQEVQADGAGADERRDYAVGAGRPEPVHAVDADAELLGHEHLVERLAVRQCDALCGRRRHVLRERSDRQDKDAVTLAELIAAACDDGADASWPGRPGSTAPATLR
jgi:hypothetical protein